MSDDEPPAPDDAYTALMSTLIEWSQYAEVDAGEGWDETTMLTNIAGRSATAMITQLAGHRPTYQDNRWVCPSCVELGIVLVRASAPCLVLRRAYQDVLARGCLADAPPAIQLIAQDDCEPYLAPAAAELERAHHLPPATARAHAASVVRALARLRRHSHI